MYLVEQPLERTLRLRTRVRPGSIADFWCRFFDRRDFLEVKVSLLLGLLLFGGMLR